jgi:hypothetical protein
MQMNFSRGNEKLFKVFSFAAAAAVIKTSSGRRVREKDRMFRVKLCPLHFRIVKKCTLELSLL